MESIGEMSSREMWKLEFFLDSVLGVVPICAALTRDLPFRAMVPLLDKQLGKVALK